jgi:hypothetical protein
MNTKTVTLFSKIFGVLFAIFGVLVSLTSVLGIISSGTASYADALMMRVGQSAPDFPHTYVLLGSALIFFLAACYFAASYSLLKHKSWAYLAVGGIAVAGLGSNAILAAVGGSPSIIELAWSFFYLYFAYEVRKHSDIFKH